MDADLRWILCRLDELRDWGIIIFIPVQCDRFYNLVREYALPVSVSVFSIGSGYDTKFVLRFKPSEDDFRDLTKKTNEGLDAYESENYDLCIERLKPILRIDEPRASLYIKLGLAHAKNYNYNIAREYLTVATELLKKEEAKKGKLNLEFRELIEQLKKMIALKTPKPRFDMTNENIMKFKAALSESKADFDDLCAGVQMDKRQKTLMCIRIAEDYYRVGDFSRGDYYLEKVDTIDHESYDVSMLALDVEKHKYEYQPCRERGYPLYFGEFTDNPDPSGIKERLYWNVKRSINRKNNFF